MVKSRRREIYLDIIRIVACFLVIVNHTNSRIFLSINPSITWFASLTYFYTSKVAVPLFIMVSGAMLLERNENYKKLLSRILRIVIVLIVFSAFYYFTTFLQDNKFTLISIKKFFISVYAQPSTNAFWYLYLYLGLLIMLPILRKIVNGLHEKDYNYLFFWCIIFLGTMPIVSHYIGFAYCEIFAWPIFNVYIGLYIIGYYLHSVYKKKTNPLFLWLGLTLSVALLVILTYTEYLKNSGSYLFFDDRTFILITLPSICIFYLIKHYCAYFNFSSTTYKIIGNISKCTFGIYLLSDYLIEKFDFIYLYFNNYMNSILAIIILQISIFSIGFLITYLLKKVPFVERYI